MIMEGAAVPSVPSRLNRGLVLIVALAHALALIVVPLALLPIDLRWGWLLALLVLLTIPHWALVHEAIHGHLDALPGRNERYGRLLAMLFGAPFAALRFGHLSHHALNSRPSERAEIFDPTATSGRLARLVFYFRLSIGLYVVEMASSLLCFLPRHRLRPIVRRVFYEGADDARGMAERAERQLLDDATLAQLRIDSALALGWIVLGLAAYGSHAWMLLAALLGRAFVVSFMDNAPHYGGPIDEPGQGYDMHLPVPLAQLVLNTNLHGTHHRHPNLPWTSLPTAFADDRAAYAGSYLWVPLRQLRGPVAHPERGAMAEPMSRQA